MSKFAEYQKNDPNSFNLTSQFSMFPQFMYHLRRSQFLRVFNSSPDETTFYRMIFNRENCKNTITMIQPTLISFSLNEKPKPVLLDSISIKDNNILLLDTFFHVLIQYGEQIVEWRNEGYQELEKYKHFKNLLELPKSAALKLMKERYPFPKFIECETDDSGSRVLISKINPSDTHHSIKQSGFSTNNESNNFVVISDDASLQDFMKHLKKLCVSQ
jgi:protein transport protein SEC23